MKSIDMPRAAVTPVPISMISFVLSVLLLAGLAFTCNQSAEAGEPLTSSDTPSADVPGAMVHIGVFGLFHPRQLTVRAHYGHALILQVGEERLVLEKSSGVDSANVSASENGIVVSARSSSRACSRRSYSSARVACRRERA